jgi:hypothetical protein
MKVILSYHPSCACELIYCKDGKELLKPNNWLSQLIGNIRNNGNVVFLGRDDKKRVEIQITLDCFTDIQHTPMFIMKAEKLRRLRTVRKDFLEFLITPNVNIIDNDLDSK